MANRKSLSVHEKYIVVYISRVWERGLIGGIQQGINVTKRLPKE